MNKPNGVTLSEWIRGSGFCGWGDEVAKLEACATMAQVLLDHVDYMNGACRVNEMVGAVLPALIIEKTKEALKEL